MSGFKANRPRWLAGLILFLLTVGLGLGLSRRETPWQDTIAQTSYDTLHRLLGQRWLSNSPVIIVYLDIPSYKAHGLDPLKPWPRELHAQLLQRLSASHARAVVFDVIFSEANPAMVSDATFAKAIQANGAVVLASECSYGASHVTDNSQVGARIHVVLPPPELFRKSAAATGMAIQAVDHDYAVRRYVAGFSETEPTLTWAAASLLKLKATQANDALTSANLSWVRYYGPPLAIPHVSYTEALDPQGVPNDFFRDKVVFVGARPWTEQFHERQDEFRSPFHSWANKELFTAGVEVHATELLNLLLGDALRRFPASSEWICLILAGLVFGIGLPWLRPLPATFAALAGSGLTLALAGFGFARGLWFPWLLVVGLQVPTAWAGSILFNSLEWYRTRRRLEAAKRVADTKIREQAALLEKANDAILVVEMSGRVLYANPSAQKLYGWSSQEFEKDPGSLRTLFLDAEATSQARTIALGKGEWNGELKQQTRHGRPIIVASRWTLIRDEAGQSKAWMMMNTDITEQKQLESQLLRAQRLNTIGTLAGGMAHDLNNALAPILMGVQLLRRKSRDDESRNLLQLIESSTYRGADMVRQVLSFARGRDAVFEQLDVGALIRELERMIKETFPKNITVDVFLPGDLWRVQGNSTQLHQILLNLAVNARDAMPEGGTLSFVADNVELQAGEPAGVESAYAGRFVTILVCDTGHGMPPEIRTRIFEPFFTTKGVDRGTGIGLSTVLRIIQAHKGFLGLESEPGKGTTFEIFLPAATLQAAQSEPTRVELSRGNGELLLVADDEQAIRELLSVELASAGYRVLLAGNGSEAVDLFRRHRAEVRLFITDSSMPVLDGAAAIAAVRGENPELPVILTGGEVAAPLAQATTLVPKPFAFETMLAAIQESLSESGPPSELG